VGAATHGGLSTIRRMPGGAQHSASPKPQWVRGTLIFLGTKQTRSNQITVRWQASTDNVKVQEYRVDRDGVSVEHVSAPTTTYIDNNVLTNTAYTSRCVRQ
jgi:hypothetical protein